MKIARSEPPARDRRIHAAGDLVPPDVLARFEARMDELASQRPDLVEYVAQMKHGGAAR